MSDDVPVVKENVVSQSMLCILGNILDLMQLSKGIQPRLHAWLCDVCIGCSVFCYVCVVRARFMLCCVVLRMTNTHTVEIDIFLIHHLLSMTPANADIDASTSQIIAKQLSHLFTPESVTSFFGKVTPSDHVSSSSSNTNNTTNNSNSNNKKQTYTFLSFFGVRSADPNKEIKEDKVNDVDIEKLSQVCEVSESFYFCCSICCFAVCCFSVYCFEVFFFVRFVRLVNALRTPIFWRKHITMQS